MKLQSIVLIISLCFVGCTSSHTQVICKREHVKQTHYTSAKQVQAALNDKDKEKIVLLLFGADWCLACKKLNKLLKQGSSFNKALHLNIDETWAFVLSRRLEVVGIPALIVFKGGQPTEAIIDPNKIIMKLLIH